MSSGGAVSPRIVGGLVPALLSAVMASLEHRAKGRGDREEIISPGYDYFDTELSPREMGLGEQCRMTARQPELASI